MVVSNWETRILLGGSRFFRVPESSFNPLKYSHRARKFWQGMALRIWTADKPEWTFNVISFSFWHWGNEDHSYNAACPRAMIRSPFRVWSTRLLISRKRKPRLPSQIVLDSRVQSYLLQNSLDAVSSRSIFVVVEFPLAIDETKDCIPFQCVAP